MKVVDTRIWRRIPGGESDDSDNEDIEQEEAKFRSSAEEKFHQVVGVLGQRWVSRPLIKFVPAAPRSFKGQSGAQSKKTAPNVIFNSAGQAPYFKIEHTDAPLVRETFQASGLMPHDRDWVIQWSGPNLRDILYQSLHEFQRVNHFPGATELTRKDRLWANFSQMAHMFGNAAFDFMPETYVLPQQVEQFLECYERTNHIWIVKPHASSRGRGIFLLRDIGELPLDEVSVVSRYVHNPMLIQGLKFDLRVYVLVTSFDPLCAYVYREGLTRFASRPYSTETEHLQDTFRHLTNYSINKSAKNFVENRELQADNVGHKWSLSALNKHLKCVGVDVKLMWSRIMDLIMKTLLSVEPSISARTRELTQGRNCFELYGFDVLVDNALKPWLLEVNLSPSMQADSPLDWQVKSSLLSDAFNLVGIHHLDRNTINVARMRAAVNMGQQRRPTRRPPSRAGFAKRTSQPPPEGPSPKNGPVGLSEAKPFDDRPVVLDQLNESQLKTLARAVEEQSRCDRNFIPLYPTRGSIERYACITEARSMRPKDIFRSNRLTPTQLLVSVLFGPHPVHGKKALRSKSARLSSRLARPGSATSPGQADGKASEELEKQDQENNGPGRSGKDGARGNGESSPVGTGDPDKDYDSLASTGTGATSASGPASASPSDEEESEEDDADNDDEEDSEIEDEEEVKVSAEESKEPDSEPLLDPHTEEQERLQDEEEGSDDEDVEELGVSEEEGSPRPVRAQRAASMPVGDPSGGDPHVSESERRSALMQVEDMVRDLGQRAGCRLVLMEYLQRLSSSCDALGAVGRAKLAQSASYARISKFQRELADATESLRDDDHSSPSAASSHSTSFAFGGGGGLVDELATSCRRSLASLQRSAFADEAFHLPERDPTEDDAEGVSSPLQRIKQALAQREKRRRAIDALPNLSAGDLESILSSAACCAEFRALLDPFGAGDEDKHSLHVSDGSRAAPCLRPQIKRRRPSSSPAGHGGKRRIANEPLLPASKGRSGPLSELLRVSEFHTVELPADASPKAREQSSPSKLSSAATETPGYPEKRQVVQPRDAPPRQAPQTAAQKASNLLLRSVQRYARLRTEKPPRPAQSRSAPVLPGLGPEAVAKAQQTAPRQDAVKPRQWLRSEDRALTFPGHSGRSGSKTGSSAAKAASAAIDPVAAHVTAKPAHVRSPSALSAASLEAGIFTRRFSAPDIGAAVPLPPPSRHRPPSSGSTTSGAMTVPLFLGKDVEL